MSTDSGLDLVRWAIRSQGYFGLSILLPGLPKRLHSVCEEREKAILKDLWSQMTAEEQEEMRTELKELSEDPIPHWEGLIAETKTQLVSQPDNQLLELDIYLANSKEDRVTAEKVTW